MGDEEFYILSIKWSVDQNGKPLPQDKPKRFQPGCQFTLIWWEPKNNGYTRCLEKAGRYSRADVEEHAGYYNNGVTTCAVPCSVVDAHANKMTGDWHMHTFRKASDAALKPVERQTHASSTGGGSNG